MKTLRKIASGLCIAGIVLASSTTSAAPVAFNISAVGFTPGTGYGQDANENGGTLLDVRFSTSGFFPQIFTLNAAGDFTTFSFGTIGLFESDNSGGITAAEQDGLGVTAAFTFLSPLGGPAQTLIATGTAITGSVSDNTPDYTIHWDPLQVAFGSGGLFEIALGDLGFTDNGTANALGQTQTEVATITLVRAPGVTPTSIPEPSSVALLGLGLLGAAFTRRKAK